MNIDQVKMLVLSAIISLFPFAQGLATSSPFEKQSLTGKYSSWGLSPESTPGHINLAAAWIVLTQKLNPVTVAVIDTGIDPHHPHIKDNLVAAKGNVTSNNYGVNFSVQTKNSNVRYSPYDTHGHGTHVAGIIKSVFPQVKMLVLKYFNPEATGQQNLNATIAALEYAVNANVDIINYSGGGPEASPEEKKILELAQSKGILVVAAAGNDQVDIDKNHQAYYPASYDLENIITVLAHNEQLGALTASNFGKKRVDISAPGHRIRSSIPSSQAGFMTGTSQATAFVTGVAAIIKSLYPELKAKEIKHILKSSAEKVDQLNGKCSSQGIGTGICGKLDAYRAVALAQSLNRIPTNPSNQLVPVPNTSKPSINARKTASH